MDVWAKTKVPKYKIQHKNAPMFLSNIRPINKRLEAPSFDGSYKKGRALMTSKALHSALLDRHAKTELVKLFSAKINKSI